MTDLVFLPPTPRSKMTKPRAAKIFLSRNGVCWRCRVQIRAAQWTIEHPDPLALSGSDKDEDLWPVHVKCGIEKTKTDVKAIARRNRLVTASYVPPNAKPKSRWKRRLPSKRHPFGETVLREPDAAN